MRSPRSPLPAVPTSSPSLALTLVAVLGALAQWFAWRLRVPAVITLSVAGLLAGPVLGWLDPRAAFGPLLDPLVGLAVAVILFEGGLRLRFSELRDVASAAAIKRLCSTGVLVSWALGTAAAVSVGGLSLPVSLVFGAILVVTGPTVILPLLRNARLERRAASLLKWEGIVNDPTGALLAVLVYEYFTMDVGAGDGRVGEVLGSLLAALAVGTGLGVGAAWVAPSPTARCPSTRKRPACWPWCWA